MSAYSDGAPAGSPAGSGWKTNWDTGFDNYPMTPPPSVGQPREVLPEATRLTAIEGPRWVSTRVALWLRYMAYAVAVILLSALTEYLLSGVSTARHGGQWMLFAIALVMLTCSFGLWRYPTHRKDIVEQARHYVFGIMSLPGTGLAAVMWAAGKFFVDQGGSDVFATLMGTALPVVFFCTVVIPLLIYVKLVAGMRYMYRSREDDQELLSTYTRQDQLHR